MSNPFCTFAQKIRLLIIVTTALCGITITAMEQTPPASQPPRALSNEQMARLDAGMADFDAGMAGFDARMDRVDNRIDEILAHLGTEQPHLLAAWQQECLASVKIPNTAISVGLYGEDIIRLIFLFADLYVDHILWKTTVEQSVKATTAQILNNCEKMNVHLSLLNVNEQENVMKDENFQEFKNTFMKEILPIRGLFKHSLSFKNASATGKYLGISEACAAIRGQFISPEKYSFALLKGWLAILVGSQDPLPLAFFLEQLLLPVTGMSLFLDDGIPILRRIIFFIAQLNCSFLQSYWFYLMKRAATFSRFNKQIQEFYREHCFTYFVEHQQQLREILGNYGSAHKKEKEEIATKLETFVKQSHQQSFLSWLRYKKKCFSRTNLIIETLICTPAIIKLVYNHFDFIKEMSS